MENKVQKALRGGALKNIIFMNLGVLCIALGLHFFRNPNRFAFGGISGLSIVLSYFFPTLPIGIIMIFLNILLILLALIFLGKAFVVKTLYSSFAISGLIWALEMFAPLAEPLSDQKFMELLYGVFLPGVGVGMIFDSGATTGGTDIIAAVISKFFKIKISISLLMADFFIALSAGILFGVETCLYSILGLVLSTFVVDSFLETLEIKKIMVIISTKNNEIEKYICNNINRGATVHRARGAYNQEDKEVITTVLSRRQAVLLQNYIKTVDPQAFITISNSSKIIGSGFRDFD